MSNSTDNSYEDGYFAKSPTKKSIVKYYDGEFYTRYIAPFYDAMTTVTGWRKKMVKFALDGVKPGKMLDVGCGTAYVMNIARERGFEVYGVDPSLGMLEKARKKLNFTDKELLVSTACELPFPDNSFDFILASGSLAYVPNLADAAKEMSRVLKPGGTIRVIDHTYPKEKNFFTAFIFLFTQASGDLIHDYVHYFKPYANLAAHKTLGRGGFMQLFDFQKI